MFLTSAQRQASATGAAANATLNTFQWLLLLGFPLEVAAAKAMPELFSDAAPVRFVTDGVRVFLRDELAA